MIDDKIITIKDPEFPYITYAFLGVPTYQYIAYQLGKINASLPKMQRMFLSDVIVRVIEKYD